jgi:hypothetical protein
MFSLLDYKSDDKSTAYFKWSTFHDEIKQFWCCLFLPLGVAGHRRKQITGKRQCQNFQESSAEKD